MEDSYQLISNCSDDISEPNGDFSTTAGLSFPVVPPRLKSPGLSVDRQSWFVVNRKNNGGILGPLSISELSRMYQYDEIDDYSCIWKEGEHQWQEIRSTDMRTRLLRYPIVPGLTCDENNDAPSITVVSQAAGDSSLHGLSSEELFFRRISDRKVESYCSLCGSAATVIGSVATGERYVDFPNMNLLGTGESNQPKLLGRQLDSDATSLKAVMSEVIPRFLWIGNIGSSKRQIIKSMKFTLVLNAAKGLKSMSSVAPFYRCHSFQLDENDDMYVSPQSGSELSNDMAVLLDIFERAYTLIERERTAFHRNQESDEKKESLTKWQALAAATQTEGSRRSVLRARARGETNGEPSAAPRVLVISRKGECRSCVLVCAWLVRHWGMSLKAAVKLIKRGRPSTKITAGYGNALRLWEQKFRTGILICEDCAYLMICGGSGIEGQRPSKATDAEDLLITSVDGALADIFGGIDSSGKAVIPPVSMCCPAVHRLQLKAGELLPPSEPHDHQPNSQRETVSGGGPCSQSVLDGCYLGSIRDLILRGANLGDEGVGELFDSLSALKIRIDYNSDHYSATSHKNVAARNLLTVVRLIDVAANNITCSGVDHIVSALVAATELRAASYALDPQAVESCSLELIKLDLSHNRISANGATRLGGFLRTNASITSLDLGRNDLGDAGAAAILTALADTGFAADNCVDDQEALYGYNVSITALDLSSNGLAETAAHSMATMLRSNSTLVSLVCDYNQNIPKKMLKRTVDSLRLYNSAIQSLHLIDCGSNITAKTLGKLLSCAVNELPPLRRLVLRSNNLSSKHMEVGFAEVAQAAKFINLIHLDISGNPIGNIGAMWLSRALYSNDSPVTFETLLGPSESRNITAALSNSQQMLLEALHVNSRKVSVRHLDVSCCAFDHVGAAEIIHLASLTPSLTSLDMSENNVGTALFSQPIDRVLHSLCCTHIQVLKMNRCGLQSRGASALFRALHEKQRKGYETSVRPGALDLFVSSNAVCPRCETENTARFPIENYSYSPISSASPARDGTTSAVSYVGRCCVTLSRSLKALSLAHNDIQDAIREPLKRFLLSNVTLAHLDLGYNLITDEIGADLQPAISVHSDDSIARKLVNLNIVLAGNRCDPYMLEFPGQARSKRTGAFPGKGDQRYVINEDVDILLFPHPPRFEGDENNGDQAMGPHLYAAPHAFRSTGASISSSQRNKSRGGNSRDKIVMSPKLSVHFESAAAKAIDDPAGFVAKEALQHFETRKADSEEYALINPFKCSFNSLS